MTARQMELLSGAAMQELDDEALGAFSRKLPWGSYGMLARASLTSPDLGMALKRWCRHHALLTDDIRLELVENGASAAIVIDERAHLRRQGEAAREFCLVHVLRNIHGLACWYIDSRIPLQGARLSVPGAAARRCVSPHVSRPAELRCSAGRRSASTRATWPCRCAATRRRCEQMLQRALPLTVLQYRRDRLLVQQVRQALAAHPEQTHSADGVAHLLHMSARTLHRQLKEEGASLQQLKDEVRCERAKELLYRSGKPVKQVAAAVGFRNEKSFIRAFRQWTGFQPGGVSPGRRGMTRDPTAELRGRNVLLMRSIACR